MRRSMRWMPAFLATALLVAPQAALELQAGQPPHAQAKGHDKVKDKDKNKGQKSNGHPNWDRRFQGLDDNNNGVISRRAWNGDDRSFRVHDWNRDGVIAGNELRAGARPPQPRGGERDEVLFARMDANGDGRVTRNEWSGTPATFDRLDFNDDGSLSPYEYGVGR